MQSRVANKWHMHWWRLHVLPESAKVDSNVARFLPRSRIDFRTPESRRNSNRKMKGRVIKLSNVADQIQMCWIANGDVFSREWTFEAMTLETGTWWWWQITQRINNGSNGWFQRGLSSNCHILSCEQVGKHPARDLIYDNLTPADIKSHLQHYLTGWAQRKQKRTQIQ